MSEIVTPEWVKHAVFYQIFPDRFARSGRVAGAAKLEPWDTEPTERGYKGGDLWGVVERLDHLQDLGVTALYFNPVFQSASNHRYHTHDYFRIDPLLGGDEAFDALLAECRRRGLRVVLDGVFNHCSRGFFQFNDVLENGAASPWVDWFTFTGHPANAYDHSRPPGYAAWWGLHALPKFDTANPAVREFLMSVGEYWIRRGIDGWRLDVAPWLPHGFWKHWRRTVKAINPEAYLVAENIRDVAFNIPFLQGDEFDAVMNYNFAFACDEFFFRERTRITASRFDALLRELREAYPACVAPVMQNLFGSHDTARLASHAFNRDRLDYRAFDETYHPRDSRAPLLDTRRPDAHARALQRLFVLFQMTHLGAPMVYYGDEAGLWGANDPCCRKPMLWPELAYEAEAADPAGGPRAEAQPVAFDPALFDHYRRCIALRHALPVLRTGTVETLLADDARQLLVHRRRDDAMQAIVAINRSEAAQRIVLDGVTATGWRDRWNGGASLDAEDAQLALTLPPLSGAVLVA